MNVIQSGNVLHFNRLWLENPFDASLNRHLGIAFLPCCHRAGPFRLSGLREWNLIQLARQWYVRDSRWKLNQTGELFYLSQAPFEEPMVAADTKNSGAVAARKRLQAALDKLHSARGILDEGDGAGRHANRNNKK